jgi:pilus assembly protein CpaE
MADQTLRILIVDPSLADAIELGEILDAQPDMQVVGVATTGHDGVQRAGELRPAVVLIDVQLPDMDGVQATWLIASKHPDSAVIIVTAEKRPEYMQRLIVAGAQGYLIKPLEEPVELPNTIRAVHLRSLERRAQLTHHAPTPAAPAGPVRLGRRLALFSPKGGQGKTSISVNLAVMLRQVTEQRVVLVDADLRFGDANILLDLPYGHSVIDLLPHMDHLDADIVQQVLTPHPSGLKVLVRPSRPELAETVTATHIERLLDVLPRVFDYVVFDCEVSYDEKLLAVLDRSDSILLVLTPNMGALHNAKHFLKLADGLGYPRDKIDFVVNRANSNVNLLPDDIERALGPGRYFRLGSFGRLLTNDLNDGTPTVLAHPRSEFARVLRDIAEHITKNGL